MAIDQWTRRTQDATRTTATKNGETWTSADLEFVTQLGGDASDAELAVAMNRTLFSIQSIRHAIQAGKSTAAPQRVATSDRPYRGWTEGMQDD